MGTCLRVEEEQVDGEGGKCVDVSRSPSLSLSRSRSREGALTWSKDMGPHAASATHIAICQCTCARMDGVYATKVVVIVTTVASLITSMHMDIYTIISLMMLID